jgi:hypothetical protein
MINRLLVQNIKPFLDSVSFIDHVSGLVKTIEKKDGTGKKRYTFPASHDIELPTPLKPNEYADMSPNSKHKSVTYFEDWGCRVLGQNRSNWQYESLIRLVSWVNYQKAQIDELSIVHQFLTALPSGYTNGEGIQKVNILPTKIMGQEERIFSRYSFDEPTRQFLMMPYLACAIELQIKFEVNPSCLNLRLVPLE